ncbi:MAG: lipopolysaccharide biosynthesis protein, partial [Prevotella sp.]|nr:lipopolysaccharide biosynthesis protein [Prevotella sp.]
MSDQSPNNKRIAKNTIILYIRMLILMVVSLYTSRIVLEGLGVIDYGLYNVVGGIVVALGFLSGTLNTASSRFITVALSGRNIDEMCKVFNNVLFVNFLLAVGVLVFGETVGLWFLYEKMQIPEERFNAAFWVYQMSVITIMINIIASAYNACIIAHEKMKAFAYITLVDAFGKLLVAYLLLHIINYDKLIIYGFLLLLIQMTDRLIYGIYCKRNFIETKAKMILDKSLLKNMFKFISWSAYGSFVVMGFTQGLNILLNIFFNPAVNAARGISVQVQHAVVLFVTNFQTAINPQLTISTARGELNTARNLLLASSKFSFFLLCMLVLPIISETPFILNIWLKQVPEYTVSFVQIMLTISLWQSLANPLRIINQAEGNIKKFQIYECTTLLLIVPISYILLKKWEIPILVFCVHLTIELIAQYIRIRIVLPKIGMSMCSYFKKVYARLIPIFLIPLLLIY